MTTSSLRSRRRSEAGSVKPLPHSPKALAAVVAALALGALGGCMSLGYAVAVPAAMATATMLPPPTVLRVANSPGTREVPRELAGEPRVALVLGSGSMRGFAHVGILAALEEAGVHPALVVGSSAGSFAGALWAAGLTATEIDQVAASLDWGLFATMSLPHRGLVSGERLEAVVRERLGGTTIEALPVAFAAVATDARTGDAVILDRGDVALAVRASSSVPVLFEPLDTGDRLLADGALSAPTPVRAARSLGADIVVAVNVAWSPEEASLRNPLDMMFQAMQVMAHNLNREELARADVVIAPDIRSLGPIGRDSRAALVAEGRRSGDAAVPVIRAAIREWRACHGAVARADSPR